MTSHVSILVNFPLPDWNTSNWQNFALPWRNGRTVFCHNNSNHACAVVCSGLISGYATATASHQRTMMQSNHALECYQEKEGPGPCMCSECLPGGWWCWERWHPGPQGAGTHAPLASLECGVWPSESSICCLGTALPGQKQWKNDLVLVP